MAQAVRAVFDGQVLRPEQPIDLEPGTTYVVTIEGEAPADDGPPAEAVPYPLTEIARLAVDMGVADLAARHHQYAHDGAPDDPRDR